VMEWLLHHNVVAIAFQSAGGGSDAPSTPAKHRV
jgi:hypothetical protein